jgi:hypothetical protein
MENWYEKSINALQLMSMVIEKCTTLGLSSGLVV